MLGSGVGWGGMGGGRLRSGEGITHEEQNYGIHVREMFELRTLANFSFL